MYLTPNSSKPRRGLNLNDPDYQKKKDFFKAGWARVADDANKGGLNQLGKTPPRHTEASAGATGTENLHPSQFGKHRKPESSSGRTPVTYNGIPKTKSPPPGRPTNRTAPSSTPAKPAAKPAYAGSHRGKPASEAGAPPGKHRADHKHEAPYSAGKDIGASVGSTKKAPYKGKHQKQATPPHAEGKANMGGGAGRSNIPPPPASSSKSLGGTDNAKSHAKSKAALSGDKKDRKFNLKFRPSRHSGKNKEHLKALVK